MRQSKAPVGCKKPPPQQRRQQFVTRTKKISSAEYVGSPPWNFFSQYLGAPQKRARHDSNSRAVEVGQAGRDSSSSLGGKRPSLRKVYSDDTTYASCASSNGYVDEPGRVQKFVDRAPGGIPSSTSSSGNVDMDDGGAEEPIISHCEAASSDSARSAEESGDGTAASDGADVSGAPDVFSVVSAYGVAHPNQPSIRRESCCGSAIGDGIDELDFPDSDREWVLPVENEPEPPPLPRAEAVPAKRTTFESLPLDLVNNVFLRLDWEDRPRLQGVNRFCRNQIRSPEFMRLSGETYSGKGLLTAISFFVKNKAWQWIGYDLMSKQWRRLPTLSCLPTPDFDLFKEYSVAGAAGLMCANVSKSSNMEEIVVFSALTGKRKVLPPLIHRRSPVLLNVLVDSATNAYKVIAAGSVSGADGDLSRRIEVFDSRTSKWEVRRDLPTPEFGLNENQTGVYLGGFQYFVAFMENNAGRGILAYDVQLDAWSSERTIPIPSAKYSNVLQLVTDSRNVYVFSEQESEGEVMHCIDALVKSEVQEDTRWRLRNIVRVKSPNGRGLQVYPEYICCGYGSGKLTIYNTLRRDGVVYDVETGMQCEKLPAPPVNHSGDNFFSLNPLSFTLQPSFATDNQL